MRDLLVVATFEKKEDDDFTEGSAVVLNGHMIYYWDMGQDGGNHTETIVGRLTKALDPVVKKISIERAVEAEAGMTCGFEVDNLEAECSEMERKCAICGTEEDDLSLEDQEITNGLPCLELSDNEAIGAPHIDGEIACPKCMDPKIRGKKAQGFRRHYIKIFRNYPNGRK